MSHKMLRQFIVKVYVYDILAYFPLNNYIKFSISFKLP